MWRLAFWANLLIVLLSLAPVQRVTACSCMRQHPQTQFCSSDFVVLVKVKNVSKVLQEGSPLNSYRVKIKKIFKATPEAEVVLKKNHLSTASSSAACGVHLDVDETYVVAGRVLYGKARIASCYLNAKWSTVSNVERKGFKRLYSRGCMCQIMYTPWYRKAAVLEQAGRKGCIWESTPGPEDCQKSYGICKKGPAGCSWEASVPYKNCILDYQRKRELQRSLEP